jgi:hypothetical protein
MKIMAIAKPLQPLTPEVLKPYMGTEVGATLKLYLGGKVEQFWFADQRGPIFLMNVDTVDDAKSVLGTLPLVAGGVMDYELLPVGPLMPLGRLLPAE